MSQCDLRTFKLDELAAQATVRDVTADVPIPEFDKNLLLVVAPDRIANAAWLAINHPNLATRAAYRAMIENWRVAPRYTERNLIAAREERALGIIVPIGLVAIFLFLGYSLITWQSPFPEFGGGFSQNGGGDNNKLFVVMVHSLEKFTRPKTSRRGPPKVLFFDNGQRRTISILMRPAASCIPSTMRPKLFYEDGFNGMLLPRPHKSSRIAGFWKTQKSPMKFWSQSIK